MSVCEHGFVSIYKTSFHNAALPCGHIHTFLYASLAKCSSNVQCVAYVMFTFKILHGWYVVLLVTCVHNPSTIVNPLSIHYQALTVICSSTPTNDYTLSTMPSTIAYCHCKEFVLLSHDKSHANHMIIENGPDTQRASSPARTAYVRNTSTPTSTSYIQQPTADTRECVCVSRHHVHTVSFLLVLCFTNFKCNHYLSVNSS